MNNDKEKKFRLLKKISKLANEYLKEYGNPHTEISISYERIIVKQDEIGICKGIKIEKIHNDQDYINKGDKE